MQASIALIASTALGIAACGGGGGDAGGGDGQLGNGGAPLETSQAASTLGTATVLGATLTTPWGLAFLPNGRMLVTEKGGSLALVEFDGSTVIRRLGGLPSVDSTDQGGLLDIAYNAGYVYLTYSQPGVGGAGTAVARANLDSVTDPTTLQGLQVLWQQTPKNGNVIHYGSRLAFANDGTMFIAAGERGVERNDGNSQPNGVQDTSNSLGKVIRLNMDGSVPSDNPNFGAGAVPGLYSVGHRNPQGAAVRPGSNQLWITEHGPQGGDELNRIVAGANYGWPVKSYGCEYGSTPGVACRIGGGTHAPTYQEPAAIWVPTSTAPSGLLWYANGAITEWEGSLFAGALAGTTLWRITVDVDGIATSRQEIAAIKNLGVRIRDVRQGPDGNIYLLSNGSGGNGDKIIRLSR